ARGAGGRTPSPESGWRRLARALDVRSTRQRKVTDHIRDVGRVRVVEIFPTNRRNPLSADEVLEGFHSSWFDSRLLGRWLRRGRCRAWRRRGRVRRRRGWARGKSTRPGVADRAWRSLREARLR